MVDGSIVLVGMMGVGKSTVGTELAERLGRSFVDTDRMLSNRLGRPIPQLFALYGEDTFRGHETAILRSLEPGEQVVSTGGGIVLRDENWVEMHRLGVTVFLSLPTDVLVERLTVSKKKRPLLEVENPEAKIREIFEKRLPFYQKADIHISLQDRPIEETVDEVISQLESRFK